MEKVVKNPSSRGGSAWTITVVLRNPFDKATGNETCGSNADSDTCERGNQHRELDVTPVVVTALLERFVKFNKRPQTETKEQYLDDLDESKNRHK
jgi:hypothetical protein